MCGVNAAIVPEGTLKAVCVGQLRAIADYFEDPEHMRAFEEWKKERERKQNEKSNC